MDSIGLRLREMLAYCLLSVSCVCLYVCLSITKRNKRWVKWETEGSFDSKLCQKYLRQKLSKSDNCFSSYSRKCRDVFFETQCIYTPQCHKILIVIKLSGWISGRQEEWA